jgi:lipid-binding SYLF domain-containing protein
LKGGFIWSVRLGSGLVVARLPDGSWSAPSAIAITGVGVGGQIGGELTDFVFILNTTDAVKAFSHGGNFTLGANVSISAGPIGRNAEAAGTLKNAAAIYSYSKTKGLFAGVSLEGTVIVERKDANNRFYHRKVSAKEILSGSVERPTASTDLYKALDQRAGTTSPISPIGESFPYGDNYRGAEVYAGNATAAAASAQQPPPAYAPTGSAKPSLPPRSTTAVALYDFAGERPEDLSFIKGDVILILKKTDSQNDWWFGQLNGKQGHFPANYVKVK